MERFDSLQRGWPRSWIALLAMAAVGLPVAVGISLVAHVVFHASLNVWLATAICCIASAASTQFAKQFASSRRTPPVERSKPGMREEFTMRRRLDVQRLPIVFAITGHRDLEAADEPFLAQALDSIFADFERRYPSTPLLLLTPLAEGADQLAAQVARRRSIPYRVPIPMPLSDYRRDFVTLEGAARFDEFAAAADGAPYAMPLLSCEGAELNDVQRSRQYALLAAHLARAAHVLIALWDGVPSETVGGTAQAVRFRVLGVPDRYHRASRIDAPQNGPVYHIYTRRRIGTPTAHQPGFRSLRVRRADAADTPRMPRSLAEQFADIDELPGNTPDPFEPLYSRIETFNTDCTLAPGPEVDPETSATRSLILVAERVATAYQRKFIRALQAIFFATAITVFAFVSYADVVPFLHPIVIVYLGALAFAVGTYVAAQRGRWQDRAQDYRALEIGLRVQQAWDAAGLAESVADSYVRQRRSELDWIPDAIRTAHTIDRQRAFDETHSVDAVREFVLHQHAYFNGRARRDRRKVRLHHRLNAIALRLSFAFSFLLILYGLAAWLAPPSVAILGEESRWHGYLTFAIGITAAAAALFHDYAGRRAHAQQARRYEVMEAIYRRALETLAIAAQRLAYRHPDDGPQPSELETARACIRELGHEALSENSDWLLLHRDLPLELISVH